MYGFILTLVIIDALILFVVVLLQAGQGGGLASLGGGGGTESILGGRHTVTWLTKTSYITGGLFLFLSLVLTLLSATDGGGASEVQDLLRTGGAGTPAPTQAAPAPPGGTGAATGGVPIPGLGETEPAPVPGQPDRQ